MRRRGRIGRRLLAGGLAAVLILAAAAAVLAGSGELQRYGGSRMPTSLAEVAHAPAWTKPCWSRIFRDSRPLLAACTRARGRVLHTSTGDADGDAKVVLIEHFSLVVASFPRGHWPRHLPGFGDRFTVTGPMVRGNAGEQEVIGWGA